jgi:hypothetical protein
VSCCWLYNLSQLSTATYAPNIPAVISPSSVKQQECSKRYVWNAMEKNGFEGNKREDCSSMVHTAAGSDGAGGSIAQHEYDAVSMDELRKVGNVGLVEVRRKAVSSILGAIWQNNVSGHLCDHELPWTLQMVKMTADVLFTSCAAIFGDQSAVDALYDFNADIFVGDAITACSWTMSDILG